MKTTALERIRTLVVLNGSIPELRQLSPFLEQGAVIIAADGAAWSLENLGIKPSIIVGDLDSLKSRPNYEKTFYNSEIVEIADQDANDFEKALTLVSARNLGPVMVVGMQGGDLEHSFNNWSVSIKMSQKLEIWLFENDRIGIALPMAGYLRATCSSDKLVSLIPQPDAIVSTSGLRWPLLGERLALGVREGARNQIVGNEFSVQIHSGSLLIFFARDAIIDLLELPEPS